MKADNPELLNTLERRVQYFIRQLEARMKTAADVREKLSRRIANSDMGMLNAIEWLRGDVEPVVVSAWCAEIKDEFVKAQADEEATVATFDGIIANYRAALESKINVWTPGTGSSAYSNAVTVDTFTGMRVVRDRILPLWNG